MESGTAYTPNSVEEVGGDYLEKQRNGSQKG